MLAIVVNFDILLNEPHLHFSHQLCRFEGNVHVAQGIQEWTK